MSGKKKQAVSGQPPELLPGGFDEGQPLGGPTLLVVSEAGGTEGGDAAPGGLRVEQTPGAS